MIKKRDTINLIEWIPPESLQSIQTSQSLPSQPPPLTPHPEKQQLILVERLSVQQVLPSWIQPDPDENAIPIISIGCHEHLLYPQEHYILAPGLSKDLHLWEQDAVYEPYPTDFGWDISFPDYSLTIHWFNTQNRTVFPSQTKAWNEFPIWKTTQSDRDDAKQDRLQVPDELSFYIETGFATGKDTKHLYYRAGATHSGRILLLERNDTSCLWHIDYQEEYPFFMKEILHPEMSCFNDQPDYITDRDKWEDWLEHVRPLLRTSTDRLWELWEENNGKTLGQKTEETSNQPHVISWTRKITVSNLLAFGEQPHEWDWTGATRMGYGGIIGTNTAGKSSWVDVWTFGFWGQTARSRPKGILRQGVESGWVEIQWENSLGERGKVRREIHHYLARQFKTKFFVYYWDKEDECWMPFAGRHLSGQTDQKGTNQKLLQLDLEEWFGSFTMAKETSLLGVDGTNEIWLRTRHMWQRTIRHLLWQGRQEFPIKNKKTIQYEEEKEDTSYGLGISRTRIAESMTQWLKENGFVLMHAPSVNFVNTQNEIQTILSQSIQALQEELKEEHLSQNRKEPTEDDDFRLVWIWFQRLITRDRTRLLSQLWNEIWGDGRIYIDWNPDQHTTGLQLEWRPNPDSPGVELGMACRWERMMLMEGWRQIAYAFYHDAHQPVIGDVWLDEEWDGVDAAHGHILYEQFGHWHGAHILITHQDHWKRRLTYMNNMTPNARHSLKSEDIAEE
jgi:hypothetical protein